MEILNNNDEVIVPSVSLTPPIYFKINLKRAFVIIIAITKIVFCNYNLQLLSLRNAILNITFILVLLVI